MMRRWDVRQKSYNEVKQFFNSFHNSLSQNRVAPVWPRCDCPLVTHNAWSGKPLGTGYCEWLSIITWANALLKIDCRTNNKVLRRNWAWKIVKFREDHCWIESIGCCTILCWRSKTIHKVTQQHDTSQMFVQILKQMKFHPYKIHLV